MISIVVPAHNEGSVIARTLGTWAGQVSSENIEVIVVCNGCTDDTASIARRFSPTVRVFETEIANKIHALNLGDQAASGFPRIYVDADIVITVDAIRALTRRLEEGKVLAVAPTADINLAKCSLLVQKYYDIRSKLPSSKEGIGGSGVYALSETGRSRFSSFPDVVADDLYVRHLFKPAERETLPFVKSTVFPPRTIAQLITVRTRVYAGIDELNRVFPHLRVNKPRPNNRPIIKLFRNVSLWPGLLVYCYVNVVARFKSRFRSRSASHIWQRDETSRVATSTK
jgi:glycosyltransferase involved in cell wall biosynthesis